MGKISIILPTFNEAGNIGKLILTLIKQFQFKHTGLEIIVVDDNSADGTAQVIKNLFYQKLPVKLFIRKNQRGLATAIHLGIKKATGKIIILMDTDFNHQPKDISRLLQPIFTGNADIVIGSRYISGGGMPKSEAGLIQFFGSKYGSLIVSKILGLPVKETLSGFLAIKKQALKKLDLKKILTGYGEYCIRLLFQSHRLGFKLAEIPVVYGKRRYGQSKSNLVKMFIEYFTTAFRLFLKQ